MPRVLREPEMHRQMREGGVIARRAERIESADRGDPAASIGTVMCRVSGEKGNVIPWTISHGISPG